MPLIDVFGQDLYGVVSLTASINKLPYVPARLGKMGLFTRVPITTLAAFIEEQHGKLAILPTAPRGAPGTLEVPGTRQGQAFRVPHIPHNGAVWADDVQGIRAFGDEGVNMQPVATLVNNKLQAMRQNHEITHEYHRIGAIKGIVVDADGVTEIYNWFDEFDITPNTVNFDFTPGTQDMKAKCLEVIRIIEEVLGAMPYDHVHCFAGSNFFDNLTFHASVVDVYTNWQAGQAAVPFGMTQQFRKGFTFGDITFEEYRGSIAGTPFIDPDKAHFFPVGVPDLFQEINAPANFNETVNTLGKPVYAKQAVMEFDVGVKLHTQSNPLMVCTRPAALVEGN